MALVLRFARNHWEVQMTDQVIGQVSQSASDLYDENFVPALFQF